MASAYIVKLLREHANAPRFRAGGDEGLAPAFLEEVRAFEARVVAAERDQGVAAIMLRDAVAGAIARARSSASHYRRSLAGAPRDAGIEDMAALPTAAREVLAAAPESLVPAGEDLAPLVAVRTSGTSGPPLLVPHHPAALAACAPLIRATLRRRGIAVEFGPDLAGVMRIDAAGSGSGCAVAAVEALEGSGFARLDLAPSEWQNTADPVRFVAAFAPAVLTGTPAALEELAQLADDVGRAIPTSVPPIRSKAVLAAGAALAPAAQERLEKAFGAPVLEWYSATETGPIAYGCALGRGLHILPPDLLVESLDGEMLAFTGGRNPYLPLVRYCPGDRGLIERTACACGDPAPRIVKLRRA